MGPSRDADLVVPAPIAGLEKLHETHARLGGLSTGEVVGHALQGFALLASHCPLPGAEAVSAVLAECHKIFVAAISKEQWLGDFMVRSIHREWDEIGSRAAEHSN